jgi:hypothetical protein
MNEHLKTAQASLLAVKQALAREMQKPEQVRSQSRIIALRAEMIQKSYVVSTLQKFA